MAFCQNSKVPLPLYLGAACTTEVMNFTRSWCSLFSSLSLSLRWRSVSRSARLSSISNMASRAAWRSAANAWLRASLMCSAVEWESSGLRERYHSRVTRSSVYSWRLESCCSRTSEVRREFSSISVVSWRFWEVTWRESCSISFRSDAISGSVVAALLSGSGYG